MGRPRKQIPFSDLPDHFDAKTLARFLRKRSDNIYRMCRSGEIPCHRIGRSFLIVRNEFGRAWGYLPEKEKTAAEAAMEK